MFTPSGENPFKLSLIHVDIPILSLKESAFKTRTNHEDAKLTSSLNLTTIRFIKKQ